MAYGRSTPVSVGSKSLSTLKVYGVKIKVKSDRSAAGFELKLEVTDREANVRQLHLFLPALSVWVDTAKGNACKVHAYLTKHPDCQLLAEWLSQDGRIEKDSKVFSCDISKKILRYGMAGDKHYLTRDTGSSSSYDEVPIYDNKATAINAAIESITKDAAGSLAGLDLINFNTISDDFMEQMGFEKVPDELGNGVPMWKGNVDTIVGAGKRLSGFSYERQGKNKKAFIDLLESAVA